MKLNTLKIEPAGAAGWRSEELIFGREITELYGPNGSGKTPIIQSIAYCLGYPVRYRDDVLSKCEAAVLSIDLGDGVLTLRRKIGERFDIEVLASGEARTFYTDKEFSAYLLNVFGFEVPTLTSTSSTAVTPYMATVLPIFYLDQDHGYRSQYHSPAPFIRDQYAEMMRLVFGLPPKHSFDQKKLVIDKKQRLDQLDRAIVKRQEAIAELAADHGKVRREVSAVEQEIREIENRLNQLRTSKSLNSDAYSALDALVYEKHVERRSLSNELGDLQLRVNGFERIQNEIEVEINTLSLNEEARRLFSSFEDICANPQCGLFLGSSESYGKNLLYLRDQLKDLRRNTAGQKDRIAGLTQGVATLSSEIHGLETRRDELSAGSEAAALVEAIGDLARRMIDLQSEREGLLELSASEKDYIALLNERELVQNDLASLGPSGGTSDLRVIEMRSNWRLRIRHWLDVLHTMNVSREIEVDSDFGLTFGGERINQFHGSTLLRVVLAIHTATFELYVRNQANKFRFFILDTPRQQDIDRDAMAAYISELKKLSAESAAQIVFSTTDYHYECRNGDREWSPTFPSPQQPMFLGPPDNSPMSDVAGSW
jgi:predicted  nucleic acid-binding Zn-ribbon protein